MPLVFLCAFAGLILGLMFVSGLDRHVDQWISECRSKGGAAVYVYTDATLSKRIICLDVKRVDMRDNTP